MTVCEDCGQPVTDEPHECPVVPLADLLATGVTYRRLDHWTRRGILSPLDSLPGSGTPRRWTRHDLALVRHIVAFTGVGMSLDVAVRMARAAVDDGAAALTLTAPTCDLTLEWSLHD